MKRLKIILNIIIIAVAIFFAYKLFSYTKTKTDENKSIEIYSQMEGITQEDAQEINFEDVQKINPEIVAWIKSDEGHIDYPIVQCEDNEKYLRTAANGEKNIMGSIFLDYRNKSTDDPFVLIYGHMTKNNTMFGSLNEFKKTPKEDEFSIYTTKDKIRTKAVVAGRISGESYVNPQDFSEFEKRKEFFEKIRENSFYDIGYELKEDDKMINLVTCTYERRNSRLVVITISE